MKVRLNPQRLILAVCLAAATVMLMSCAGFQVKQMIDAAADAQIRMMEAQAKIDKEKRQERNTIEGEVKSVDMREKEVPDPDPKHLEKKEVQTEKGVKVEMIQPKIKVKYCVVVFSDGREKEFSTVPTSPLNAGVYYRIEYNGMNEVVSVAPIPKK